MVTYQKVWDQKPLIYYFIIIITLSAGAFALTVLELDSGWFGQPAKTLYPFLIDLTC